MHKVYILYSKKDDKFYTGYTADIDRRMKEHRYAAVHTTARYSDFTLIYYEAFLSKADAMRREGYFKTTKGKQALHLILRESLKDS
jgi:putative endonuclease